MSLFRKIFGGRSFEEERALGETELAAGAFGPAKLAFERARDKAATDADRDQMQTKMNEALDGIARERVDLARQYLKSDDIDLAMHELEGALETAVGEALRAEAQGLVDELERSEAVAAAEEVEVTDADRIAAIAGTWEDDQDEEYDEYGDAIVDGLLLLHDEKWDEARDVLEALHEEAEAPRYLWWELGRARVQAGDVDRGVEAIEAFLELMGPDEGGEARLGAHMLLARLADEAGDVDAAIAEYERAAEALEDDPRPLLELGRYLRLKERPVEAVEVLELAVETLDTSPGWALLQELGLAYADAGKDEQAVQTLESVVQLMVSRTHYDFPVLTAYTLAKLHEKQGNLQRAADMFRSLSKGSDRVNHHAYHYQAGRVLLELGLEDEARRMLKRAAALTEERHGALEAVEPENDAEREAIRAAREKLDEQAGEIADKLEILGER